MLNVKEAVKQAKAYVADLFAEEGITNLGLEGVEHDDGARMWVITLGFNRSIQSPFAELLGTVGQRSYKTVRLLDVSGEVVSVMPREIAS